MAASVVFLHRKRLCRRRRMVGRKHCCHYPDRVRGIIDQTASNGGCIPYCFSGQHREEEKRACNKGEWKMHNLSQRSSIQIECLSDNVIIIITYNRNRAIRSAKSLKSYSRQLLLLTRLYRHSDLHLSVHHLRPRILCHLAFSRGLQGIVACLLA